MKPLDIIQGRIHSPYFIFIDGAAGYSDQDVMGMLGVRGFKKIQPLDLKNGHLHITDDGRWLHVADDWRYGLWHDKSIESHLAEIAKRHDIFTYSVGDSDWSYHIRYYSAGTLVRERVVEDPKYDGGEVSLDFGPPLPGEPLEFPKKVEIEDILPMVRGLGIKMEHREETVRTYSKRYKTNHQTARRNWIDRLLGR